MPLKQQTPKTGQNSMRPQTTVYTTDKSIQRMLQLTGKTITVIFRSNSIAVEGILDSFNITCMCPFVTVENETDFYLIPLSVIAKIKLKKHNRAE